MKIGRSRPSPSYYRSGGVSKRSPFEKFQKSRPSFWSRLIDFLVLIAILLVIVYSLTVNPTPHTELNSEVYRPSAVYQKAVSGEFKSFKNRNKITLNEKEITAVLKKQFPEITSVSIHLPLLSQTPTLKLVVASPSFSLSSKGSLYVVDSQGVVAGRSNDLPQIKGLPQLVDETNFDPQVGKQFLSAADVDFINNIITQVKHAKVPIASLILPPKALEVDLKTADRAYFVKFYLGSDVLTQIGQFLAARQQFDHTNKQPSEYLDVRVPGKIYYQ